MFETLESRTLMSASPAAHAAASCVNQAISNYITVSDSVEAAREILHERGASSLHELLHKKGLSDDEKHDIKTAEKVLQDWVHKHDQAEAKLENKMEDLRKQESTTYKKYNHTAFNQQLALFKAYDKAFYNQLFELESLD